jgi:[protein-PII] uridylyltransferase
MEYLLAKKEEFIRKRNELFNLEDARNKSLRFSLNYSLMVEDFIKSIAEGKNYNFSVASYGSFNRRELSPFSDIDLIFITNSVKEDQDEIKELVQIFWDNGIEASHTVREFSDIKKYLKEDLHTFTQFFETRFLFGSIDIYNKWNEYLFSTITPDVKVRLLKELFADIDDRYLKYGESPKVLEPNVKLSAGGLRDFQSIEWMYILTSKSLLNKQAELTQAEVFIELIKEKKFTTPTECARLLQSYNLVVTIRNLLHLITKQKTDRFEFNSQQIISELFYPEQDPLQKFMKDYFAATNTIYRFSKSMVMRYQEEISNPLPDSLSIDLDDDYKIKGKVISLREPVETLTMSEILRAFYFRGQHSAHFDENLLSTIVKSIEEYRSPKKNETESSVFFKEILKLPQNVGQTLTIMNELGVLGTFMPEFNELVGFLQHGVYHCYTADEHTLVTIQNVEKLEKDSSTLGKIFNSLKSKELLYLALLFHDIAKPIGIAGHEIMGVEISSSIMYRLGYSDEEIEMVSFLVRNHLVMEQIAFRRNLNDPETLNNFSSKFSDVEHLDLLYLVTYADLSAVNPAVWTSWKSELLEELYLKAKSMIERQITGEELLRSSTYIVPQEISKYSQNISEDHVQEHMDLINDIAYAHQFSDEEIAKHVEEIQKGTSLSTLFKELNDFTNVTVITKDFPSLLSKICGVLSINDVNIHDAKIFTRKDGIVIDTFNVTDFRSGGKVDSSKYEKIDKDLKSVISGMLQLAKEFDNMKTRWWRIENKFFKRKGKVKVSFEGHEKYTIIDVASPDRLGFLYKITSKMNELGLAIYFAKISTRGDDIVDSFYVLNRDGQKISLNGYDLVKNELTEAIYEIL